MTNPTRHEEIVALLTEIRDRLPEAARVLRHHANAATPGPWGVGNGTTVAQNMEQVAPGRCRFTQKVAEPHPWDYGDKFDDDEYAEEQARFDADYIATMHPGVALALADWLDKADDVGDGFIPDEALAVAEAILGGAR